ncbi:fibronectin type III domain-containing protein [Candidatus Kaiserbacteria bacterium]|nr:fibronectin type III domain-containing protein [Candidatus Kaiserbacteria bacterium]
MKQSFFSVLVSFFLVATLTYAQSNDVTPPEISNVEINIVSPTEVEIKWQTDEDADSLVNYGLKPDYGIVRIPEANRQSHSVTLDDLEPGRQYYFRVVSADEEGNQGISADYKIQTDNETTQDTGQGQGEGQSESQGTGEGSGQAPGQGGNQSDTTTEEIIEQIQEITEVTQLQEILDVTIQAIQGITDDLTIIGPPTVIPETTTALVKWSTDREADSTVLFSKTSTFDGTNYEFSQSSTAGLTQEHEVQLIGLESYTDYSFKVISTDSVGVEGESRNFTFKTKASLPDIRNLRIVKVEEDSATIAWDTTVPAKALIEYQDLTTGVQNSIGRPTLATTHQMRIADLTLGTRYVAFAISENSGGDRVRSQPITFITSRDTAPPIISNVTNESTIFPGGESRIQTIVEWRTDEPAYCSMTYREGVAGGVDPIVVEDEQINYTERHVQVVVDFAPATVYQFWLNCTDEAGNAVQSENFVLFTPIQEKNIIDLILENFESTFGWVKNITG